MAPSLFACFRIATAAVAEKTMAYRKGPACFSAQQWMSVAMTAWRVQTLQGFEQYVRRERTLTYPYVFSQLFSRQKQRILCYRIANKY